MKALLARVEAWVDARPRRERFWLALVAAVAVYGAWDVLLFQPVEREHKRISAETRRLQLELPGLAAQLQALVVGLERDPDAGLRREQETLRAELNALDGRIEEATGDFVPPAEMVRVLRELLERRTDLQLVRLEALEPRPVGATDEGRTTSTPVVALYRHGLLLEFEGGYFETLRYLGEIEALPWNLFWGGLDYEVVEYPEARVRLRIHTLSRQEGSIGV